MKFLVLDATNRNIRVAVYSDGEIFQKVDTEQKKASEILFSFIEHALQAAGLKISEVDFFAATVGPGSFTGTRIGITATRTFSQFLSKPCVALENSEDFSTLIENAKAKFEKGEIIPLEKLIPIYSKSNYD